MSSNKSATRRLSLMTGSSLIAAGLAAFAFAGVTLAPSAALADYECGDPNANGTAADTFTCSGSIPSITYPTTNGTPLVLHLEDGLVVTGGIHVTPTGTNAVYIGRTAVTGADIPLVSNSNGAAISIERTAGGNTWLGQATPFSLNVNHLAINATGTTAGIRIRTPGTQNMQINMADESIVTATAGAGFDIGTGGSVTIQARGTYSGTTAAISVVSANIVTINIEGAGLIDGRLLLANTGTTNINNRGGEWRFGGTSIIRNASAVTGTATITNEGMIFVAGADSAINFGGATGVLVQRGYLVAGEDPGASTLTLQSLNTWTNSGFVVFGKGVAAQSDGETNDRIVVQNNTPATFNGSGEQGTLVMDVDFTASQADCSAAVTADCLDLRGHNTAGTTNILVNAVATGFTAERIVLVDVAGAGSNDGVFRISELSPNYRALGDGMIDGGLFLYQLTNDTDAQQHVMTVAGVDEEAVEINLVGRAALVGWETATATFFDRQTDVRTTLRAGGGLAPGGWIKVAGNFVNRNMVSQLTLAGDSVDVVTNHNQDTFAVVGGIDLVAFSDDVSAVLFGLTAGQVNSELQFKESPNGMEFDGHSFGAYASYVGPGFFVDGILNSTNMDATFNGSTLGLNLEGEAKSIGYRLEGGLRFDWGDGIWFEPLAALSYVRTDLGDMEVADGVTAKFDRFESLRGSLGARLSGDVEMGNFTLQLAGIGRVWNEFRGEADSRIATGFGDFAFTDANDGMISELGASLGLFGLGGRLSAQLSSGVKFASDYQSVDVALGARYQW